MDETCDRRCCECERFIVLDDRPRDLGKWFGVCQRQVDGKFGESARTWRLLEFVYGYGRRGDDACESQGEWFEEGE